MKYWSRRKLLKSGALVPVASAISATPAKSGAPPASIGQDADQPARSNAGLSLRERSLLDFGWRFHFGHANDPAKDFGFGSGARRIPKDRRLPSASHSTFDDSAWRPMDLPHDWAIELPFKNDPGLPAKALIPSAASIRKPASGGIAAFSTSRLRCRPAHLRGVRWRLSRSHGRLQRVLHRTSRRRIRSIQL